MKGIPLQPVGKSLGGVFQRCAETTLEYNIWTKKPGSQANP